jgi:hypothetical protein
MMHLFCLFVFNVGTIHALRLAPSMMSGGAVSTSTVGTANLEWSSLGFEYRQTNSFVQLDYKGTVGVIESLSCMHTSILRTYYIFIFYHQLILTMI